MRDATTYKFNRPPFYKLYGEQLVKYMMNNFPKTCYAVIKNWLTEDETSEFLNDYKNTKKSENDQYQLIGASKNLLLKQKSKILEICNSTGLNVDLISSFAIYTDTSWTDWSWHQDHESFYFNQQHENYLNFYVILEKENPQLSGLSIIPMNALENLIPEHMNKIINSGAKRFFPEGCITKVLCDETDTEYTLPVNLDSIAIHPELVAGDLLLIRGDVIHRTQDTLTKRTAISIRCTQGSSIISKEKLMSGGNLKRKLLDIGNSRTKEICKSFGNNNMLTAKNLFKDFTL